MDTVANAELLCSHLSTLLSQNGNQPTPHSQFNVPELSEYKNGKRIGFKIGDSDSEPSSFDIFTADINENCNRMNLGFQEISYSVPDHSRSVKKGLKSENLRPMKSIIHGVSGEFRAGELTAIMGPSGSGKTTLLNILAGYTTNFKGSVLVNDLRRKLSSFRKQARYIMQDDALLPNLTVMEAMTFAAQLKLPAWTSKAEVSARVFQGLQTMGISSCAGTRTCSLSGGERKRLAIALELITNPPILLFDEATTGLDSSSCYNCVSLLRSLANDGGRTIVATIHQPSARIFELFDSLYLLADGHCLYQGPTKSLVPFLDAQSLSCPITYNPADFILDVACGEYGQDSVLRLRKVAKSFGKLSSNSDSSSGNSTASAEVMEESFGASNKEPCETLVEHAGMCHELNRSVHHFLILLNRSWKCIMRDWMLTRIRFALTLAVAIFLGIVYEGHGNSARLAISNCGGILFSYVILIFTALYSTILTFPLEREIIVREHLNCWYSLKSYYWARSIADIPFQIFFPVMFLSITYYMTDQPLEWFRFSLVCAMGLFLSLVTQSIGQLFGSFCSLQVTVGVASVAVLATSLFNGLFMRLSTIPWYVQWMGHISHVRYTVHGAFYSLYGFGRADLHCDVPYCLYKDPNMVLQEVDAADVNVLLYALIAAAMLIGVRIATYFGLRYKVAQMKQ